MLPIVLHKGQFNDTNYVAILQGLQLFGGWTGFTPRQLSSVDCVWLSGSVLDIDASLRTGVSLIHMHFLFFDSHSNNFYYQALPRSTLVYYVLVCL